MWASQFPDDALPEVSVVEAIRCTAQAYPDKLALVDDCSGESTTYRELVVRIDAVARALVSRGWGSGDVAAIYCPNNVDFPVLFHGVLAAGMTVTTLNVLYTVDDVTYQLIDSGAIVLITVAELLETAIRAASPSCAKHVLAVDIADGKHSWDQFIRESSHAESAASPIDMDGIAVLPYSSGTTGRSKGVMLSHRNLVANLVQSQSLLRHEERDVILAILPLFHIYGMQVMMNLGLTQGSTVVIVNRFKVDRFLRSLERFRVTRTYVAPPVIVELAKCDSIGDFDLSTLTSIYCGAAPLDAETTDLVARRLDVTIAQAYGMTELSPITHATPYGEVPVQGSIGKLAAMTEARIIDLSSGLDVPVGVVGELLIRGPQVMQGYWRRPEETAGIIDSDGWLHTGDVVTADADGNFFVVDRLKELIKYKGYQVAPAELEAVLLTDARVHDAAVVGREMDGQEVPVAFVVRADPSLTASDVIAYIADRVAPYKRIRVVEFIGQIPKSPSGKILRRQLKISSK